MMRVLVTGVSGHVGGPVALHLFQKGYEVVGVSRTVSPTLPADIEAHSLDISDTDFGKEILGRIEPCEAIVHAAAGLDLPFDSPDIIRTNCLGTQHVLRIAQCWKTDRFVFLSGVAVCGLPAGEMITEDSRLNPSSPYLASKVFGEHLTKLAESIAVSRVSLRVSSPVGPRLRRETIFRKFVEGALEGTVLSVGGRGTRKQNYVDVRDVASAIERVLEFSGDGVFNVGSLESISNIDLARLCVDVLGSSSAIEFTSAPDPHEGLDWQVSVEKAKRVLGFSPQFSIENSIRALAEELSRR
jgi:nucleoside-diphosphate-sugar epimerase